MGILDIFKKKRHTMPQDELRVLELFGGIGACTSALERIGVPHKVVDYVEIDKYACASYNAMHGTNFEPQDICEWDKDIECDLIMHGSPCQDFSVCGQGAGGDEGSDTRSSLMWQTVRIVGKLMPAYVIWENVKNVTSKKHRHNFDKYLDSLEELGYVNYWKTLNARDYGVPQNRERVFVVSIRNDINGGYEFPKPIPLKLRLKDVLEGEAVEEKYYLSNERLNLILNWKAQQRPLKQVLGNNSVCRTLTARGAGEYHSGMIMYSEQFDETTNAEPLITKEPVKPTIDVIGNYSPSNHDASRIVSSDGIAPTVKENHGTVTATNVGLKIRKLTPKECFRLMGFSDEEFMKAETVSSNSQLYKQAGNSIVVNCLAMILENLLKGKEA